MGLLRRAFAVRLLVMAIVQLAAVGGGEILWAKLAGAHGGPLLQVALALAACAAMAAVYAALVRLFERRWPAELEFKPGSVALGLGLGFALFTSVYLVLTAMGVAHWSGFVGFAGVLPVLVMAALAGVGEELVFRGVLFRLLEDSFGTAAAIAVSALVFGLLHAFNPGATAVSTLAIALEAGVLLAAAFAWSRTLWLPIALHFAWNFTEGGVFGAAVSGGHGQGSLIAVNLDPTANALLTGGAFGPEASLVAVVLCTALGGVFIWRAALSGNWRPASMRLMLA